MSERNRNGWLELLQTSGPFLTLPVMNRVFPNGLPVVPVRQRATVRALVAAMMDDRGTTRHKVIETVLREVFDWQGHLVLDAGLPATLTETIAGHGIVLRPDFGYFDEDDTDSTDSTDGADEETGDDEDDGSRAQNGPGIGSSGSGPWKLLGMVAPWGTYPLARTAAGSWTANAVERLAILLRAKDVPVGVVTDGRWWALVTAPRDGATGAAVWDASLFSEEPAALESLVALLSRARFQASAPPDRLPALFAESLERQEEVTEQLGRQVRDAVELLITTLDRLDREADGALLRGVSDDDFYAGVVTMMMRVVFLLFAEERRLLPSDDDLYVSAYSVSHLVEQLEQADSLGAVLGHRTGAWHRLLAVTRAVHSGVQHEDLRLPAYGGGLFDPGKYPWLEGRPDADTPTAAAKPPAVDDHTVLRMLRYVQYVVVGGERRRLTFRVLDVEQIGYVYEGLLELEVRTAAETVFGLRRPSRWPQKIKADAEVTITEVAGFSAKDFADRTGWSLKRVEFAPSDAEDPLRGLLRHDELGNPAVFPAGSRYVTRSHRRAVTGAHYTPQNLSQRIVEGALEPIVYRPGPLETADTSKWRIRPSDQIKALKVADIAMGSGAFLVAACRYLADKLIEAWLSEGDPDALAADLHRATGRAGADAEADELQLRARRQIAERCLYGVDINPLAVEMAKLSLWLVTMDRERPFGFLDDRLKCGDSLLGLVSMEQLETLHVDPAEGRRLHRGSLDFAAEWRAKLAEAADLRRKITAGHGCTIRDIEHKARLLAQAEELYSEIVPAADAITATGVAAAKLRGKRLDQAFRSLYLNVVSNANLDDDIEEKMQENRPSGTVKRQPFHWPLEFPEIFVDTNDLGFDVIIGNPPFLGGQKISGTYGYDYLAWLQRWDGNDVKGSADLAARFMLRANRLLSKRGQLGYVATNTLVEGTTLRVGLEQIPLTIRAGRSQHPWPTSSAGLHIVELWASSAILSSNAIRWLDGEEAPAIGTDLQPYGRVRGRPFHLRENERTTFQGSNVVGSGFALSFEEERELIDRDPRSAEVIQPYINGKDLNQRPDCSPGRSIINFHNWHLKQAEQYTACIERIRRLVKPFRDRNNRVNYRDFWWRYGEHRPGLYQTIGRISHVLAIARVSDSIMPVRVPTGSVFSEQIVVFALSDFASLALLSSSVHSTWVVRYTSTIGAGAGTRYAPQDVFVTFPRPKPTTELEILGRQLDIARRELMLSRSWGLTKTYNRVHSPDNHDPAIQELRDIHVAIDEAVMRAYGWDDLDLKIGHHKTKIGIRWTVSKEARFELLDRLLDENHRRYKLENPE